MFQTLAYYATVFHRGFTAYTTQRLQKLGLNFGSLFPVIYVGKHPGCTQAELTAALGLDWGYSQRTVTKLVEDLRELESRGTEILTCGTCLDYYGLKEKLAVGRVTNMYRIAEILTQADRLVNL